jgi:hypothetical protein
LISLSILAVAALVVLAVRFPPAVVLVYAVTSATDDSRGISSFLQTHDLDLFVRMSRIPFLLAVVMSFIKIWRDRARGEVGDRAWRLARALAFCCVWIVLGSTLKGEPIVSLAGIVIAAGIPASIVAMAYYRNPAARTLFIMMLIVQLALSVLILLFPDGPLAELAALKYAQSDPALPVIDDTYRGGVLTLGLDARHYAQHYNPHAYGLYALVGTVVGGFLLRSSRALAYRLAGAGLLAIGLFGWSVTVPRGATVGLVFGAVVAWFRTVRAFRAGTWARTILLIAVLFTAAWWLISAVPWNRFMVAGSSFSAEVRLRTQAAETAAAQVLGSPLFGITQGEFNAGDLPAHQIMLSFATLYGLPVGLCALWFVWCVGAAVLADAPHEPASTRSSRRRRRSKRTGGGPNLSRLLGGLVLGAGLTNNAAAPILFWVVCAVVWMPWSAAPAARSVGRRYSLWRRSRRRRAPRQPGRAAWHPASSTR